MEKDGFVDGLEEGESDGRNEGRLDGLSDCRWEGAVVGVAVVATKAGTVVVGALFDDGAVVS